MDDYVSRMYRKEGESLEIYHETVDAVLPFLGHDWRPDFHCNDHVRDRRARHFATGQLAELTFDSAVVFHGREGLTSIKLCPRSPARFVVARIHRMDGETRVQLVADNERRVAERRQVGRR
jgi:hypothetical protein